MQTDLCCIWVCVVPNINKVFDTLCTFPGYPSPCDMLLNAMCCSVFVFPSMEGVFMVNRHFANARLYVFMYLRVCGVCAMCL